LQPKTLAEIETLETKLIEALTWLEHHKRDLQKNK
jgi:hypothetical protein